MFRESVYQITVFNAILRSSRFYSSKKFEIKHKFRFSKQVEQEPRSVRSNVPYETTGGPNVPYETTVRPNVPYKTTVNSNARVSSQSLEAPASSPYQSDDLVKIAELRKSQIEHLLKTNASNVILTGDKNAKGSKFKSNHHYPTPNIQGEILFGIHPVLIALQARRRQFFSLYMKTTPDKDHRREEIENLAKEKSINLKYVHHSTLNKLSGQRVHQGICADVTPLIPSPYVQTSCAPESSDTKPPVWLLLYNIMDPMNFGAILRSSYFFGVNRVLCTRSSSCVLSPVVSKASSGALEVTEIHSVDDVTSFVEQHKRMGWWFVGTFGDGRQTVDVNSVSISKPTVILMGSEGDGLGTHLLSLCDVVVNIRPTKELNPLINSLNVSAAASVILHRLLSNG